jgi:putative membrane protein
LDSSAAAAVPGASNNNQAGNQTMESILSGLQLGNILATIIYSFIGIFIFLIAYWILDRLTPFSIKKEIEEDQNTALGIIIGSCFIALSIIIAAAIVG